MSALEPETRPHHALGERRAQIEAPRQRRESGSVDVARDPSGTRIRGLRTNLQEASEVSGDGLHVAPADTAAELVPIEPEISFLVGARTPKKRLADTPFGDGARALAFHGNEEHAPELGPHRRILPFDVAHAPERDRAHERRLDGTPARVERQRLELDTERREVRSRTRRRARSESSLDELPHEALRAPEVVGHAERRRTRELGERPAGDGPRALEKLDLGFRGAKLHGSNIVIGSGRPRDRAEAATRPMRYGPPRVTTRRTELRAVFACALVALGCAAEHPGETGQRPAVAQQTSPSATPKASAAATGAPTRPATENASSPTPLPSVEDGPRAYAKTRFVWIRSEPDIGTDWIGFLWTAGSTKLKSTKPRSGPGCETWYPVEPRGWVCVDGRRVTLDRNDPVLAALHAHGPDLDSPRPHRYGESIGLKRYDKLPTPELQKVREPGFEEHRKRVLDARGGTPDERLAGIDLALPTEEPPSFPELLPSVHEGRVHLLRRSTVAYSREVRWGDRGFLLAGDYTWIPKDRVKLYAPVTFRGTSLDTVKLPIAFFRGEDRPQFRRADDGKLVPTGEKWKRLSFVELGDESVEFEGERYLALRTGGLYVKARDAVVPKSRAKTPWGDAVGSGERQSEEPKGRRSWLEVSILGGWLIAYEDTKPVYATMISAGRGGEPVEGRPTLETASTPTGSFPINGKFATATMEAPGEFVHSDVPWVQNLVGPYALHTAYWHDNWGKLMSAGCVNVSPDDAKWLYEFTDPKVPSGWHGVRWVPKAGPTTMVIIHG